MIDFWKAIITTIITSLFSWPVAIVLLGLMLRPDISALIKRLRSLIVKHGDTSIEAQTGGATEQSERAKTSETDLLASSGQEDRKGIAEVRPAQLSPGDHLDAEIDIVREKMIDFGKNIPIVQAQETKIRSELQRTHFVLNDPATTDVLIRNLAFNQALVAQERLYRLIFGSQISLLKSLNVGPPHTEADMRRYYEKARKQFPKFYGNYSFDEWRNFLVNQGTIMRDSSTEKYAISEFGREFLKWLIAAGASENKFG